MKVILTTSILVLTIALTACGGSTTDSTGTQDTPKVEPSAQEKQPSHASALGTSSEKIRSPYIGGGYPGKFTPSKDVVTDIYAMAHGQTVEGGWFEQWFLANKESPLGTGGLKLRPFPQCLPLATAPSTDTLVWQWNTLANGNAGVQWTGAQFYSYVNGADFLNGDQSSTTYVLGVGRSVAMGPANNELSPKPTDEGLVQSFRIDDRPKCKWQVFALPFKDCPQPNSGDQTCLGKPFEQYRRVLQAWTETECELLKPDANDRRWVRALPVAKSKYGDWTNEVSTWTTDSLWHTDGIVWRNDDGGGVVSPKELEDTSLLKPFFAKP